MHAGRLDAAHQLDRPRKFALKRADPRHLLHERSEAERTQLVEKLISGVGTVRQPFLRKQHACARRLAIAYEHRIAVGIDVEGDIGFLQRAGDAADVLPVEPCVEHLESRAAQKISGEPRHDEDRDADHRERDEPP